MEKTFCFSPIERSFIFHPIPYDDLLEFTFRGNVALFLLRLRWQLVHFLRDKETAIRSHEVSVQFRFVGIITDFPYWLFSRWPLHAIASLLIPCEHVHGARIVALPLLSSDPSIIFVLFLMFLSSARQPTGIFIMIESPRTGRIFHESQDSAGGKGRRETNGTAWDYFSCFRRCSAYRELLTRCL